MGLYPVYLLTTKIVFEHLTMEMLNHLKKKKKKGSYLSHSHEHIWSTYELLFYLLIIACLVSKKNICDFQPCCTKYIEENCPSREVISLS